MGGRNLPTRSRSRGSIAQVPRRRHTTPRLRSVRECGRNTPPVPRKRHTPAGQEGVGSDAHGIFQQEGRMRKTLIACVVVALLAGGGTAVASKLVTSKDIKNGTIQSVDIGRGEVTLNRLSPGVRALLAK